MKSKRRVQDGVNHFCVRGNNRQGVFYSSADKILFLIILEKYSKKYNFEIIEFVIMSNHFHALVKGENISEFAMNFLKTFSFWYNKRNRTSGRLFETPFASWSKPSDQAQLKCSFYILQNPVLDTLCKKPEDYEWSSYSLHYNSSKRIYVKPFIISEVNKWGRCIYASLPAKERKIFNFKDGYGISLRELITVNTSLIDTTYTPDEFSTLCKSMMISEKELPEIQNEKHTHTSGGNYSALVEAFLAGKSLASISKEERKSLILLLIEKTNTSLRQIASYLGESYAYVWRLKKG